MGGKDSEGPKKILEQQGQYRVIQNIYEEHELKYVLPFIKPNKLDRVVMDNIKGVIGSVEGFSDEDLDEIILYAVMTNDPDDVDYIMEHSELCEQCGWCCKYCDPILLREGDIERLGSFEGIELYDEKYYKMSVPCKYLVDNKCSVYDKRPNSCKTFPIGLKNLTLIVQRSKDCGLVFNFLVEKVYRMCELINDKKMGGVL